MSNQSGFSRIARDIFDLVELQMQLLSIDGQVAKRKAARAVVAGATAATLGISALTTLLVGGGYMLHESAGWSVGASLLATAGTALLVVVILGVIAALAVKSAADAMSETKSEFSENLKWIKAVLVSPKTSPRNQIRAEDFPEPYPQTVPEAVAESRFSNHSRLAGR